MTEPSAFEFEMAIEKLKQHTELSIDQIPAELIKAGGRTIRCEIHKLITVGSRFTTGLRSRIFGCKSNRPKTSTI